MEAIERVLLSIVIGVLSFPLSLPSAELPVSNAAGLEAALATSEENGEEDTIVLAAGTYVGSFEYLPGSSESYSLSIRGDADAEDVVLDGNASGRVLTIAYSSSSSVPAFEISVSQLTIQNGDSTGEGHHEGGGIRISGTDFSCSVRDCIIRDNKATEAGGGMYLSPGRGARIENNRVFGNSTAAAGDGTSQGAGVWAYDPGGSTYVMNNVIAKNVAEGPTAQGGGLFVNGYGTFFIYGNTIYGNQADSGAGAYAYNSWTLRVFNNIIFGNSGNTGNDICIRDGAITNRIGFNNDYSDFHGDWTSSGGNISQDPSFADAASRDFHLNPGSPCIDAGNEDAHDLPLHDFEGDPRICDGDGDGTPTVDMGADERYVAPEGTIGTELVFVSPALVSGKPKVYIEYEKTPGKLQKKGFKVISWGEASAECLWQKKIPAGTYDVRIAPRKEEPIAMGTFSVREPTVAGVTPEHDVPGAILSIAGSFFTSKRPKVYLRNPITSADTKCKVVTWLMDATTGESSLDCVVPELPPGNYQLILETKIGAVTWGGTFAVDAVIP